MASACLGRTPAFEQDVAAFAGFNADQNERDHIALTAAVKCGPVANQTGVQPDVV